MTGPAAPDRVSTAAPDARRSAPNWLFTAACALAVFVFAATYANTLHNALQFDDLHVVSNNLFIRNLGNIPRYFTDASTFSSVPLNAAYRPLVTTTLAIDYAIGGGLDPLAFHVSQLLLLAVLGVMIFAFLRRVFDQTSPNAWNRYVALGASLVFTIHTANTETANYISARSEILSTMGIVGSFLIYIACPAWRRTYVYLLPMLVGALAKEPAVMFAPLLFVYVLLFQEQVPVTRAAIVRTLRLTAVPLGVGVATFFAMQGMKGAEAWYGGGSRVEYFQTQLFVWLHYARLFVLPVGLTADTDLEPMTVWYDTRVIAGALFVGALFYATWWTARRPGWRPVAFGLAWFALGLLPSSSVFPLAETSNEHRIFLPYIGLVCAVAWMVVREGAKRIFAQPQREYEIGRAALAIAGAIVLVLATGSRVRNRVWATEKGFWSDIVEKSPRNARALMNYGSLLLREGDDEGARERFERAHVMAPNYAILEINLGIVSARLGDSTAAQRHYLRALELQPNSAESHYYYAHWLTERGRAGEAEAHLREAIRVSPATTDARALLMNLLYAGGNDAALDSLATSTLAIAPTDPTALAYAHGRIPVVAATDDADGYFVRALGLMAENNYVLAAVASRRALILAPGNPDILNNLGWARAKLGYYELSVPAFESALQLRPDYPLARNNLAWVKSQLTKR